MGSQGKTPPTFPRKPSGLAKAAEIISISACKRRLTKITAAYLQRKEDAVAQKAPVGLRHLINFQREEKCENFFQQD
jgi:uncharacterized HAD superfamily protein